MFENGTCICQMQIWRTTRSVPGTSRMKGRLVSLRCFVLTILPQKSLASSLIWYVLFRCGYEVLVSKHHEKGYKSSTVRPLNMGK